MNNNILLIIDKILNYTLLLTILDVYSAMEQRVIIVDPEILRGTPVFLGTRVPVKNLFDYLEEGESLEGFLDDFPSVKKEQVIRLLEISRGLVDRGSPTI